MQLPNKIESIKPRYSRELAIKYLERYADEWIKSEDWWHGDDTFDINIFTDDNIKYRIAIYGLVRYNDSKYLETDTSNKIDNFSIKMGDK